MQKLILFRQQIESLNDDELQQCMVSFGGKETETLFEDLFEELTHNKMDNLNRMNSIISKIKQSRKPKTMNNNNNDDDDCDDSVESVPIPIKLTVLPYVLISEISSFLEFPDQLQFEKANRAIFIGSRSSTKPIHSLNGKYFMKLIDFCNFNEDEKKEIYLQKFRMFNSLTIRIPTHNKNDNVSAFCGFDNLFRNIQQLTITAHCDHSFIINLILPLLYSSYDLSNIKTFRLIAKRRFSLHDIDPIDTDFISIMTRNSKLEYFECFSVAFKNKDYNFLKTVKGFAAHGLEYSAMSNMCLSICDLQSLHIDAYQAHAVIPYIRNYNLKELCLHWNAVYRGKWRKYGFKIFEQNMECLERIYFDVDRIDMEILRIWIIKTMKTLKYICFDLSFSGMACDIFDALIKSLENVKKRRLKLQFIGINTNRADGIILIKLAELISILSRNCDHWMILYYDNPNPNWHKPDRFWIPYWRGVEFDKFVGLMEKEYGVWYTERSPERTNGFVITNKGCNMNGYHENWLMECKRCRCQKTIFYGN